MKLTTTAQALIFLLTSTAAAGEPVVMKNWHTSPVANPASSTAYQSVAWATVQSLHSGMTSVEAERQLGQRLQRYHHPSNAIVYSMDPAGQNVEVALRLSDDGTTVVDLSYKIVRARTR